MKSVLSRPVIFVCLFLTCLVLRAHGSSVEPAAEFALFILSSPLSVVHKAGYMVVQGLHCFSIERGAGTPDGFG